MIVIVIIGIVALIAVAAYNAGIVPSLILIAVTSGIVLLSVFLKKKEKNCKGLMKFFTILSFFSFALGVIMFVVGLVTGESTEYFSGEICSICGGTGRFLGDECPSCFGGWELMTDVFYPNITWFGILIAAASVVVFLTPIVLDIDVFDN